MATKDNEDVSNNPIGTAGNATAPTRNRDKRVQDVDAGSGDPFIKQMSDIAGKTPMDGNAQVDSPQSITKSDGSPGNSH